MGALRKKGLDWVVAVESQTFSFSKKKEALDFYNSIDWAKPKDIWAWLCGDLDNVSFNEFDADCDESNYTFESFENFKEVVIYFIENCNEYKFRMPTMTQLRAKYAELLKERQ